ncbi:substrate-binding domain-containing protein [Cellulomonas sp. McL0617]|uniref:substrate-binding domain-containing protein n=1 Tax=Cellulomonas sp. McL0617 TaxID=3415675 RepID=UPI003CE90EB7
MGDLDAAAIARITAFGTSVLPRVSPETVDGHSFDHFIGRTQVDELLRRGERRIVCATLDDPRVGPFAAWRVEGATAALMERGMAPPVVVPVSLNLDAATAALAPLISDAQPLGVCCYNDDVAIAVVGVALRLGATVPDQVAVVGVDRTDVGQLTVPRLSTVAIDIPVIEGDLARELRSLVVGRYDGEHSTEIRPVPDQRSAIKLVRGETS